MAHGGVALLPSSWAMQCVNMSLSYGLNIVTVNNAVMAITWIMIGGLVGWPFILVLGVPFGLYLIINYSRTIKTLTSMIGKSLLNLLTILTIIITIDSFFYKKLVLIPLNIVLYNVFGGEGEGPEIFGIEPFSYYVLNLLINFNAIAVLGFVGILATFKPHKNWLVVNLPLLTWSIIFGSQPHKEERFLYPVYGLIVVNAAITIDLIISCVDLNLQKIFNNNMLNRTIINATKLGFIMVAITVSILRIVNLVENYDAPLQVSSALFWHDPAISKKSEPINVCVGREWYHFPNSFFLPDNHRLRFVKSGFDGLLPGDFIESVSLFELTSYIPKEMNNKNVFVDSMVIPFEKCDYYIDNSGKTNDFEPYMINPVSLNSAQPDWHIVTCHKLINPSGTHKGVGRLLYIPTFLRDYFPYDVEYMQLCLLKHLNP